MYEAFWSSGRFGFLCALVFKRSLFVPSLPTARGELGEGHTFIGVFLKQPDQTQPALFPSPALGPTCGSQPGFYGLAPFWYLACVVAGVLLAAWGRDSRSSGAALCCHPSGERSESGFFLTQVKSWKGGIAPGCPAHSGHSLPAVPEQMWG